MNYALKNCRIYNGEEFLEGFKDIKIENGKIIEIGDKIFCSEEIDCQGKIAVPGYVDIHTHGIAGFDNSNLSEEEYFKMTEAYHSRGTTSFIPTFPTIDSKTASDTFAVYLRHSDEIPCIHLEGPFINEEKKGAQNPEFILRPDKAEYANFISEYGDLVGRVTLSPERDENFELTKYLVSKGIVVSFGHTSCSYDIAMEFFEITDSIATHMFNAMPPVHHREPGITVAALMNENTACEIIPDMIHLHPEIVRLIFRLKGASKTICISDSIAATCLDEGNYIFSGLDIKVMNGSARLRSGNLAGSIITMAEGVRNLVKIGIKPEDALMSATSAPAKAMSIDDRTGYIKTGRMADILLLDEYFTVRDVFKNGIKVT
ncbi:MAG: N-acetylglucosamine-6-phosphate deacetylase [Clostridia bacterium]|nr:N-acetylglucosamine-6-phosphate deacetylase [Clostridia bacterium]MBN2883612.1 N-acetylglucosamine-6-phosphate deacetylase [Clostridia bacterium]